MPIVRLKGFRGEKPLFHPTLLNDIDAQTATNVRLETGALRPLRGPTTIEAQTEAGTILSIYRYSPSVWLEWNVDVNAVGSPIPNDTYDRVYFTGDTYPRFSVNSIITSGGAPYPANSYKLGIPSPTPAMNAALNGSPTDPNDIAETRFYVVTYVDAYGSEGPPSLPTSEVEWRPGQTVDLTSIPVAPAGNYNIANKRIYRVNTGTTGSVYQFVAEIAVATASYNDAVASDDLGEALSTTTFDPPPDDSMTGLVVMPGEFMAAFFGNVVCFSEPGYPHAWPLEYQLTTDSPIVGIGVFGNSLLVTTEKNPYVITGTHPSSTTMSKLEIAQACVSKRSVVDMGETVAYASPDGLIAVGVTGVTNLTAQIFNREEWQKLVPSTISGFYWEGMYIGFYNNVGAFMIKPAAPEEGVVFFDTYATAGYTNLQEDLLYLATSAANTVLTGTIDPTASTAVVGVGTLFTTELAVGDFILVSGETRQVTVITDNLNLTVDSAFTDNANDLTPEKVNDLIVSWDSDTGNLETYTWKSKPFHSPSHTNLGVVQVLADTYPVTVTLTADGVERWTGSVISEEVQFLPSGYLARVHEVTVSGTTDVHEVLLATTMEELKRV